MSVTRIISILIVILVGTVMASRGLAAGESSAAYFESGGTLTITNAATNAEALAAEDLKFIQLAPDAYVVMKFPDGSEATPDGTGAADLLISTVDVHFPSDAEILVSEDGSDWKSMGVFPDTANLELDPDVVAVVALYVKVDQATHHIDPTYPDLGFDLNAVTALNLAPPRYAEITNPVDGAQVSGWVEFSAVLHNDQDDDGVQWAVRFEDCSPAGVKEMGNVGGFTDPYSWDGESFSAGADTSTWAPGTYCFVFNPKEKTGAGEEDAREISIFTIGEPEEGDFCEILWKPPIKLEKHNVNVGSTLPIKLFLADCDGKKIHGEAEPELVVNYLGNGEDGDTGENGDEPVGPFPLDLKRSTGGYQFHALFHPELPGSYEAVVTYLGGEWKQAFEVVEHGNGKDKPEKVDKLTGREKEKPGKPETKPQDGKPKGKPGGKPGKDKEPKKP